MNKKITTVSVDIIDEKIKKNEAIYGEFIITHKAQKLIDTAEQERDEYLKSILNMQNKLADEYKQLIVMKDSTYRYNEMSDILERLKDHLDLAKYYTQVANKTEYLRSYGA